MKLWADDRFPRFWTLNSAAWAAYGLISFAGALPYVGLVPHLNSVRAAAAGRTAFALTGLLSTGLLRLAFRWQRKRGASLHRTAPLAMLLAYFAGLATSAIANLAREVAGGQGVGGWASLLAGAVAASAIYLCWCACYFAVHAYQEMQAQKQDALRAKVAATEAQWIAFARTSESPFSLQFAQFHPGPY